jgi:hypothetical protein
MGPTTPRPARPASKAVKARKLTEQMLRLERTIEKQEMGSPERLEMLRQQASLSDERESLRSRRLPRDP